MSSKQNCESNCRFVNVSYGERKQTCKIYESAIINKSILDSKVPIIASIVGEENKEAAVEDVVVSMVVCSGL